MERNIIKLINEEPGIEGIPKNTITFEIMGDCEIQELVNMFQQFAMAMGYGSNEVTAAMGYNE